MGSMQFSVSQIEARLRELEALLDSPEADLPPHLDRLLRTLVALAAEIHLFHIEYHTRTATLVERLGSTILKGQTP